MEPDEVFHSRIKEPDFDSLNLPLTVRAESAPMPAFLSESEAADSGAAAAEERASSGRVVSRSQLPALSIFDTMSSVSTQSGACV